MGAAMLWVMLFHSLGDISIPILGKIKSIGYGGVDIFLFLSGIGLYFSLTKSSNIKDYYKKRLLRIYPYYIPIVLMFSLFAVIKNHYPIPIIFTNITAIAFFLKPVYALGGAYRFDWYIPSLLALYLVTPAFFRFFKKKAVLSTIAVSCIAIIFSILIVFSDNWRYLLIFTTRIPIFFIGLLIGKYIKEGKELNNKSLCFLFLAFIAGCGILVFCISRFSGALWYYGLWWYPFILITLPLSLLISCCMNSFSNYKFPILTFIGQYTLSIYLIHERSISILTNIFESNRIINVLSFIATIILAYFYQNAISYIMKKIRL